MHTLYTALSTLTVELDPHTFTVYHSSSSGTSGGSGSGGGNGAPSIIGGGGGGSAGPVVFSGGSTGGSSGEVLGAQGYKFSKTLQLGSRGADVTELQRILIKLGLLKVDAPTGYFGTLTKAAVRAYQKMHNIDQVGLVGPKTRAQLNQEE